MENTTAPRAHATRSISAATPHPDVAARDVSKVVVVNSRQVRRRSCSDLGSLPYELRVKIIMEVRAGVMNMRERGNLLLVNKEFHEVLAPFFWHMQYVDTRPWPLARVLEHLRFFADAILPRYGSFHKSFDIVVRDIVALNFDFKMLFARIMAQLPNLSSVETKESLAGIVSISPHLSSITSLTLGSSDASTNYVTNGVEVVSNIVLLISRCPNLEVLEVVTWGSRQQELPALVAAIASRPLLQSLDLDGEYLGDTMATADWKCRLTSLDLTVTDFPFPIFHAFISQFASTLVDLTIATDFWDLFLDYSPILPPIHFLHLKTLNLTTSSRADEIATTDPTTTLLTLFKDSPLESVQFFSGGGVPGEWPEIVVKDFIDNHRKTLKYMGTQWSRRDDDHVFVVRNLIEYAKGCGVELVWFGHVSDGVRNATL